MTSQELSLKIENEVSSVWTADSDWRRCLIPPEKKQFRDWSGKIVELWLVFDEAPGTDDGYKIIYHEETDQFGLAVPAFGSIPGTELHVVLGLYARSWKHLTECNSNHAAVTHQPARRG
jgi:hypothetical protein